VADLPNIDSPKISSFETDPKSLPIGSASKYSSPLVKHSILMVSILNKYSDGAYCPHIANDALKSELVPQLVFPTDANIKKHDLPDVLLYTLSAYEEHTRHLESVLRGTVFNQPDNTVLILSLIIALECGCESNVNLLLSLPCFSPNNISSTFQEGVLPMLYSCLRYFPGVAFIQFLEHNKLLSNEDTIFEGVRCAMSYQRKRAFSYLFNLLKKHPNFNPSKHVYQLLSHFFNIKLLQNDYFDPLVNSVKTCLVISDFRDFVQSFKCILEDPVPRPLQFPISPPSPPRLECFFNVLRILPDIILYSWDVCYLITREDIPPENLRIFKALFFRQLSAGDREHVLSYCLFNRKSIYDFLISDK